MQTSTPLPLRDIVLPPPPDWWPPAPGWWVLAILAVVLLVFALRHARLWVRRRAQRRAWLQAWREAMQRAQPVEQVAALSELLRRACLVRLPEAATLSGDAWLQALDGADPRRPFSTGDGRLLRDGPFRAQVDADAARALGASVQRWLLRERSADV